MSAKTIVQRLKERYLSLGGDPAFLTWENMTIAGMTKAIKKLTTTPKMYYLDGKYWVYDYVDGDSSTGVTRSTKDFRLANGINNDLFTKVNNYSFERASNQPARFTFVPPYGVSTKLLDIPKGSIYMRSTTRFEVTLSNVTPNGTTATLIFNGNTIKSEKATSSPFTFTVDFDHVMSISVNDSIAIVLSGNVPANATVSYVKAYVYPLRINGSISFVDETKTPSKTITNTLDISGVNRVDDTSFSRNRSLANCVQIVTTDGSAIAEHEASDPAYKFGFKIDGVVENPVGSRLISVNIYGPNEQQMYHENIDFSGTAPYEFETSNPFYLHEWGDISEANMDMYRIVINGMISNEILKDISVTKYTPDPEPTPTPEPTPSTEFSTYTDAVKITNETWTANEGGELVSTETVLGNISIQNTDNINPDWKYDSTNAYSKFSNSLTDGILVKSDAEGENITIKLPLSYAIGSNNSTTHLYRGVFLRLGSHNESTPLFSDDIKDASTNDWYTYQLSFDIESVKMFDPNGNEIAQPNNWCGDNYYVLYAKSFSRFDETSGYDNIGDFFIAKSSFPTNAAALNDPALIGSSQGSAHYSANSLLIYNENIAVEKENTNYAGAWSEVTISNIKLQKFLDGAIH